MVHTAIKDDVIGALVTLLVLHAGQVRTTGSGEEPAHLHGQLHALGNLLQQGRHLLDGGQSVGEVIVGEVGNPKARAVLQPLNLKAVLGLEQAHELHQHLQLLALTLKLLALGVDKVVQANQINARELLPVVNHPQQVLSGHAKLGSGVEPQQHVNHQALFAGHLVDVLHMQQ